MKRTFFLSIICILSTTLMIGCTKEQQKVQTGVPTNDGLMCSEIESERDRLAREAESYRQLAQRRQEIFDQLRRELMGLIESGQVQLVFRRGMIVMQLPNQILFKSGRARLTKEGAETISTVGAAIKEINDRRFLVAGHTDDQPIESSSWSSNWHLSSARAQVVLNVLLDAEIAPDQLGLAGFGEHDPVGANDTDENRAHNRRTEIMVVPDLEQVFRSIQSPNPLPQETQAREEGSSVSKN